MKFVVCLGFVSAIVAVALGLAAPRLNVDLAVSQREKRAALLQERLQSGLSIGNERLAKTSSYGSTGRKLINGGLAGNQQSVAVLEPQERLDIFKAITNVNGVMSAMGEGRYLTALCNLIALFANVINDAMPFFIRIPVNVAYGVCGFFGFVADE